MLQPQVYPKKEALDTKVQDGIDIYSSSDDMYLQFRFVALQEKEKLKTSYGDQATETQSTSVLQLLTTTPKH